MLDFPPGFSFKTIRTPSTFDSRLSEGSAVLYCSNHQAIYSVSREDVLQAREIALEGVLRTYQDITRRVLSEGSTKRSCSCILAFQCYLAL